jgi:predicted dehydrogenase
MVRIGVMGCGVVSDYGHLPAIHDMDGIELVSLFDPDPARVNAMGARYPHAARFTDVQQFFEQSRMDVVLVASPAPTHLANVKLAAKYGLHVLCEKPLAMTEEDAEEMVALMKQRGLMLFSGFCYRFSPVSLRLKQIVESGAIGDVRALRLIYLWNLDGKYEPKPDGSWGINQRRHERMLEGGPLVDCGVHQIDLARFWVPGEVISYEGIGAWLEEYEAPDHMYLHMNHACGAHTMVEVSFSYCATSRNPVNTFRYELIGTGGLVTYDREGWRLELRHGQGTEYLPGASEKSFRGMYEALAAAIPSGDPGHLPTGEDGIIATRIARAATNQAIARRGAQTVPR